jgi:two-component system cell cycle response regulator CtrA
MNILLIDDDPIVLQQIRDSLHQSHIGIKCSTTVSCEQALEMLHIQKFDLILVDINFPTEMDGLSLIKTLRNSKMNTPIIVISGSAEIQAKVRALDLGADDYILKPFEKNELIARIKRHVFRNNNHTNNRFVVGPLTLDMETKVVTIKSEVEKKTYVLKLTNKEYQLLEILVFKKGITISKFLLLQQLYSGYSSNPDAKIIDVIMCKIRKKITNIIGKEEMEKLIVTYWGRGYAVEDSNIDSNFNNYENNSSIFAFSPPLMNNLNNNFYNNNNNNNNDQIPNFNKQSNKVIY